MINMFRPYPVIISEDSAGTRFDYLRDSIGSIIGMVDHVGSIQRTLRYKPYGSILSSDSGSAADPSFSYRGARAESNLQDGSPGRLFYGSRHLYSDAASDFAGTYGKAAYISTFWAGQLGQRPVCGTTAAPWKKLSPSAVNVLPEPVGYAFPCAVPFVKWYSTWQLPEGAKSTAGFGIIAQNVMVLITLVNCDLWNGIDDSCNCDEEWGNDYLEYIEAWDVDKFPAVDDGEDWFNWGCEDLVPCIAGAVDFTGFVGYYDGCVADPLAQHSPWKQGNGGGGCLDMPVSLPFIPGVTLDFIEGPSVKDMYYYCNCCKYTPLNSAYTFVGLFRSPTQNFPYTVIQNGTELNTGCDQATQFGPR